MIRVRNEKLGPDLVIHGSAPSATRTRDLPLRRHFRDVPWHRHMGPDVGFRAATIAGRGLVCVCACGCWLPVWLPTEEGSTATAAADPATARIPDYGAATPHKPARAGCVEGQQARGQPGSYWMSPSLDPTARGVQ